MPSMEIHGIMGSQWVATLDPREEEIVARAILGACQGREQWHRLNPANRDVFLKEARAAIAALDAFRAGGDAATGPSP